MPLPSTGSHVGHQVRFNHEVASWQVCPPGAPYFVDCSRRAAHQLISNGAKLLAYVPSRIPPVPRGELPPRTRRKEGP